MSSNVDAPAFLPLAAVVLPGRSRGWMSPCRFQPCARSHVRGFKAGTDRLVVGLDENALFHPSNVLPDEYGSTPSERQPCLCAFCRTYASALRTSRGVRSVREW